MGKKITVRHGVLIFFLFVILACVFYYPIFLEKIPLNSNMLVAYWPLWMFLRWQGYPTGVPFKYIGVDEVREFFPLLDFTYESISAGYLPLWNPYNFSGYPHFANWASALFYPMQMSMFFGNKLFAFLFLKLSAIVLSGVFTYLYLRALLLRPLAAFFGGVAFAFSSTMLIWGAEIWQAVHSVLWLPLILFAIEKFLSKRTIAYISLLAFGVGFSILAGYIQTTMYILLFSLTYVLFHSFFLYKKKIVSRTLFIIFIGYLIGVGIAAIQIIPSVELFTASPRKDIFLTDLNIRHLLPLYHIAAFFIPDFFGNITTFTWFVSRPGQYYESMIYIGVVPLVLAFFSWEISRLRKYALFFLLWILLSLSFIFDLPHARLLYNLRIPFVSSAIPIRIIFLTAFSISVLSAFGLSYLLDTKISFSKLIKRVSPLFLVYTTIGLFTLWAYKTKLYISDFANLFVADPWYVVSLRNSVIPTSAFIATLILLIGMYRFPKWKSYCAISLMILFFAQAFLFGHKYFAFSPKTFFYPSTPLLDYVKANSGYDRYIGYDKAFLDNNFATVYQIYSPEGYDPVNILHYNEFLSASDKGKFQEIISRSDAVITHPYIRNLSIDPTEDKNLFRLKAINLLGVKYVGYFIPEESGEKPKENNQFELVWSKGGFVVYKNKDAFERAFLVGNAILAKSQKDAMTLVYDPKIDLRKHVILEENAQIIGDLNNQEGEVDIVSYKPNEVTLSVESNSPQFLVLTDTFYPGWEAKIYPEGNKEKGVETKIYRADYTFRAVIVPKGKHEVVFVYNPSSFRLGSSISAFSVLLATLGIIFFNKRKGASSQ